MTNDNYNNMFENIGKFVIKVSEGMVKIVEGINLMASSKAMKAFIEFIINIPDDIKDTQFFAEVQKLQKINLHYSYTEEIDKRIPFRNNILHNGIIMYADEDIDVAYELLVDLIEILIRTKEQMHE